LYQDVLWKIERWLTSEQEQRVFSLIGLAGTGKSTIAQTVAETTFADGSSGRAPSAREASLTGAIFKQFSQRLPSNSHISIRSSEKSCSRS
jgi:type II secretory pathway predicted ATPase ExeA